MSTKLFVGNLPETVRKGDLLAFFEKEGQVEECDVVKDYGFVHYATHEEAQRAVDKLDGADFGGNSLRVELSRSKVRPKAGMGVKGECFRCGGAGHWSKDCPKGSSRPVRNMRDNYRDNYREDSYDSYYRDPYYRPPPPDRYRPYGDPYDRRPPPPYPSRDMYAERDPYSRPHPDYYAARRPFPPSRDPYYEPYYERRGYGMPGGRA